MIEQLLVLIEFKKEIKEVDEKDILSIILDKRKMKIEKVLYIMFGIIFSISTIMFLSIAIQVETVAIPLFLFCMILSIICFLRVYLYKKYDNNQLVLTNKRLKGEINMLFQKLIINIPLESIDSIVVVKDFFSTGIKIMSNNIGKSVDYVLNAKEFVDLTILEIERYKNR